VLCAGISAGLAGVVRLRTIPERRPASPETIGRQRPDGGQRQEQHIVAGIYLFWVGADAPGGAFAGGAILAAMAILGFISGLSVVPAVNGFRLRFVLVAGVIVFVVAGLAGFAWASGFLAYPAGFAKPIIILIEVAMTFSIGATLALLVAGPPGRSLKP
jgi:hypothetical protein